MLCFLIFSINRLVCIALFHYTNLPGYRPVLPCGYKIRNNIFFYSGSVCSITIVFVKIFYTTFYLFLERPLIFQWNSNNKKNINYFVYLRKIALC